MSVGLGRDTGLLLFGLRRFVAIGRVRPHTEADGLFTNKMLDHALVGLLGVVLFETVHGFVIRSFEVDPHGRFLLPYIYLRLTNSIVHLFEMTCQGFLVNSLINYYKYEYNEGMKAGDRFRDAREAAGLSQGQVARYAETSQSYLSGIEREHRWPSTWELLTRLAQHYRTSADYLLGLTNDPTPSDGDAPHIAPLTDEERALLEEFRALPDEAKETLLGFLQSFAQRPSVRIIGEEE